MRSKLRVDGHPFQYLQTLLEATSSKRDGEPSKYQARLVKFFLVVFLLTVPGALSFLLLSAGEVTLEISEFQDFRISLPPAMHSRFAVAGGILKFCNF